MRRYWCCTATRALRRLLWRPDEVGLARAYVTGDLDVDGDLDDGFRRVWELARGRGSRAHRAGTRDRFGALGTAVRLGVVGLPPRRPGSEAKIRGRRHSRDRDRAVISHHYDLSNDFYALLLDEPMAYSCAYWASDRPGASLADAQRAKLELVCGKLRLGRGCASSTSGAGGAR